MTLRSHFINIYIEICKINLNINKILFSLSKCAVVPNAHVFPANLSLKNPQQSIPPSRKIKPHPKDSQKTVKQFNTISFVA